MATLQQQNNSLKRQKAYAWGKYYQAMNESHIQNYYNVERVNQMTEIPEIPTHIKDELKQYITELRKEIDCPICLMMIDPNNLKITNCGHKYCTECYSTLESSTNKCAVCRKKLKY